MGGLMELGQRVDVSMYGGRGRGCRRTPLHANKRGACKVIVVVAAAVAAAAAAAAAPAALRSGLIPTCHGPLLLLVRKAPFVTTGEVLLMAPIREALWALPA